jgi:hypothetical protein
MAELAAVAVLSRDRGLNLRKCGVLLGALRMVSRFQIDRKGGVGTGGSGWGHPPGSKQCE